MSGGGTQKRHIMQSGPRHVPAEFSRGEACPLSNGHHRSFAFPTDVIITPPFFYYASCKKHSFRILSGWHSSSSHNNLRFSLPKNDSSQRNQAAATCIGVMNRKGIRHFINPRGHIIKFNRFYFSRLQSMPDCKSIRHSAGGYTMRGQLATPRVPRAGEARTEAPASADRPA
jgi:hypothetical protein